MKHMRNHRKLELALKAYAESVKANGAVAAFLKDRLNNWPVYAAAAGSALALSTSAMADIIHNPNRLTTFVTATGGNFSGNAVTNLAGYGTAALFLKYKSHTSFLSLSSSRKGTASLGINGGRVMINGSGFVKRLALGAPITSAHAGIFRRLLWYGQSGNTINGPNSSVSGGFFNQSTTATRGTGFAGFILPNGDPGWLKIEIQRNGVVPRAILITDWALAINGETITAGETQTPGCVPTPIRACTGGSNGGGSGGGGNGGGTTVPEPSSLSLSLFAMGSVAVLAWRKMRREKAVR